jgi:hypothetical protein
MYVPSVDVGLLLDVGEEAEDEFELGVGTLLGHLGHLLDVLVLADGVEHDAEHAALGRHRHQRQTLLQRAHRELLELGTRAGTRVRHQLDAHVERLVEEKVVAQERHHVVKVLRLGAHHLVPRVLRSGILRRLQHITSFDLLLIH